MAWKSLIPTALLLLSTATLTHAQWTGLGAGGAGTDFNATGNWTGGTINGNFTLNTSAATLGLSADQSLGSNGLTFFPQNTAATTLSINGNGAGVDEVLTIGGNITFNRALTSATAHVVTLGSDLNLNLGNSVRSISGGGTGSGGSTFNVGALLTNGGIQLTGSTHGVTLNLTNNNNDFTGAIGGDRGTLNFTSIADYGTASALGKGTVGTAISANNISLNFTGTTDQSSNRTWNIGNTSGGLNNNSPNNSKLTLSGTIQNNIAGGTINLGGTSTGLSEISGVISDGSNPATKLTKTGGGSWKLSGANTYTGSTSIALGILEISSLTNIGSADPSSLGKVTLANSVISLGGSGGGTLRYVGTGSTSDRAFSIGSAGSSSSATLINNGTGALDLSGGLTSVNTAQNQSRTFILDGTNADNNIFSGNISFSFAPTAAVNGANATITKNGPGLWILGGASSYTFTQFGGSGNPGTLTTNVNAGTLRINNAAAIAGGIGTAGGSSLLNIAGGVLELTTASGDFTRDTGASATTVNLSSGGFSAFGGDRIVNLGGAAAGKTWGTGNFMTTGGAALQFSSTASDSTVQFQNPINLGTTGTNTRTVQVHNGSANVDAIMNGALTASGGTQSLTKSGAGTLSLTNTNTYNGTTTISAGTLSVSSTGTINNTSGVTISPGAHFQYNSTTPYTGGTLTNNGGKISGTGSLNVSIALDNLNDVLSPGNSPGVQGYGANQTWSSFTYDWETNDFNGTNPGTNFDQIAITGTLNLTGSLPNSYELNILSLTGGNLPGIVPDFTESNQQWAILTASTSLVGFDASLWNLDTTGFSPSFAGSFSLSSDSNTIYLNYTAVPEPTSLGLLALGAVGFLVFRRRPRSR